MTENKKVQNLYDESIDACAAYVKAYNDHVPGKKLKAMKKDATEKINAYNLALSREVYKAWAKAGDVVKTAIVTRFVPGAKKAKFTVNDDDVMSFELKDTEYYTNLPEIQRTCGADVFADAAWLNKVEKLTWLIAGRINKRIAGDPSFKYEIMEASGAFEFPEEINPLTDDGVICALQSIFDSILFVPGEDGENSIHTTTADDNGRPYCPQWEVIRESMTKAGWVNEVVICNTTLMTQYIANAMHGILTEKAPNTLTVA